MPHLMLIQSASCSLGASSVSLHMQMSSEAVNGSVPFDAGQYSFFDSMGDEGGLDVGLDGGLDGGLEGGLEVS